jgi:hypothetical protein
VLAASDVGGLRRQGVTEHKFGRGKVVWANAITQDFAGLDLAPDFEFNTDNAAAVPTSTGRPAGGNLFCLQSADRILQAADWTFRVSGKVPELWHADTGVMEKAPAYSESDGRTTVPLKFDPSGSIFVVFCSPSSDEHLSSFRSDATYELKRANDGSTLLLPLQPGRFVFQTTGSTERTLDVAAAAPAAIGGPWEIHFPPNWGAPEKVTMDRLVSWPDYPDDGVKYFSGTATYVKDVDIAADQLGDGSTLYLDLGTVKNLAHVKLNGTDLGILWKPPFRLDITAAAKPGSNHLEISITNLWPNRIIGDLNLPDDIQWSGMKPAAWPQWMLDGKPSPTGRLTFYTWRHWDKGASLLPSGLIGPVQLEAGKWIKLQ